MKKVYFVVFFIILFFAAFSFKVRAEWVQTELTAYTPYECGGRMTASGVNAVEGHTIACNWLPFGTVVYIYDHPYVVEDTGGMVGIDIFMEDYEEAMNFGRQSASVWVER